MADELERALLLRDLELMGQPRNPNAVQPGRAGLLDLGVGLPERLSLLNQIFNPVEAIGQSMNAGARMMSPNMGVMDRLAALGDMASGIAGVVAPVAAASRAGTPAATALMEGLLGGSPTQEAFGDTMRAVGRDVVDRLNQPGQMPTVYSNPILGAGLPPMRPSEEILDLPDDEFVTLYHGTTREAADKIRQTGRLKSAGEPSVYLTTDPSGAGYGDGTVVPIRVRRGLLQIDDEFPSGRTDFRIDLSRPGGSVPVQIAEAPQAPSLPTPRTDAEAMARDILQLRAEGRAGEVTDQMRAAADPQYMYYNTPLPMDYASRMARAAGRRNEFHGTTTGSDMTYADAFRGSGTRQGIGFVTSDNPYVSSSYADPQFGSVFPMLNQPIPENAPRLDLGGRIWSEIPEDLPVALGNRTVPARQIAAGPADVGGVFDTNQISRGASFDYPSVEFSNILDRSIHAPRPRTDDGMDIMREFQRLSSEPSTVTMRHDTRGMRSRFALFDPEFAHLRNLSASLAGAGVPLGLLAMSPEEEQY